MIVAMTRQGVIGKNNQIPWHLPADLQRFKKITMGYPIVMGRKTFESLPGILPGRRHIVLTRNKDYLARGCEIVTGWEEVETLTAESEKIFVIGGADIHEFALPRAQQLYLTLVHAELKGDTYFPEWNKSHWKEVYRKFRPKDGNNQYDMEYIQYQRITGCTKSLMPGDKPAS